MYVNLIQPHLDALKTAVHYSSSRGYPINLLYLIRPRKVRTVRWFWFQIMMSSIKVTWNKIEGKHNHLSRNATCTFSGRLSFRFTWRIFLLTLLMWNNSHNNKNRNYRIIHFYLLWFRGTFLLVTLSLRLKIKENPRQKYQWWIVFLTTFFPRKK
jgi:hypothetical protein